MKIMNLFNNFYATPTGLNTNPINRLQYSAEIKLPNDTFTKSQLNKTVNFAGNTSHGSFLRSITGVRDPYSDVIVLTTKQMNKISVALSKKSRIRPKLKILKEYESSMLPVEHEIFKIFNRYAKKDKDTTFSKILKEIQPEATQKLIEEQNVIFDKIEKASENLKPEHKEKIIKLLDYNRELVQMPRDSDKKFKRKGFIHKIVQLQQNEILDEVEVEMRKRPANYEELGKLVDARMAINEKIYDTNINGKSPVEMIKDLQAKYIPETLNQENEFEEIIDIANELPTSKTSINAFITKYWNRSDEEIGNRILNQSVGTIEHIEASSKGGENEASNFLLATRSRNEERGDMPLPEYQKLHPEIPTYMQHYIDDIIAAGHRGRLNGHEWYPYVVADTIEEKMGIKLDLSKYAFSPERAFKTLPIRLKDKYPKYSEFVPDKPQYLDLNG